MLGKPRIALVAAVCKRHEVEQALEMRSTLATKASIATIAIVHGSFGLGEVLHRKLRDGGWHVHDASRLHASALFTPVLFPRAGYHWPRRGLTAKGHLVDDYVRTPSLEDARCSALKALAWNLTQFELALLGDVLIRFDADPVPWMHAAIASGLHFAARHRLLSNWVPDYNVSLRAGSDGLDTALVALRPSNLVYRTLRDKARTASFVPRTNTFEDVLETVFAARASFPPLPVHHLAPLKEAADEAEQIPEQKSVAPSRPIQRTEALHHVEATMTGGDSTKRPYRLALCTVICNTTDYYGSHGSLQIERALALGRSLHAARADEKADAEAASVDCGEGCARARLQHGEP